MNKTGCYNYVAARFFYPNQISLSIDRYLALVIVLHSSATFPPSILYYNIDMVVPGEEALIRKVKKGDLDAYGAIVQDYQSSVFNVCYRILGNRQEAEDLTQEAFLRAYHQIASFDLSRPFGPWMRTLAANLCLTI